MEAVKVLFGPRMHDELGASQLIEFIESAPERVLLRMPQVTLHFRFLLRTVNGVKNVREIAAKFWELACKPCE